MAKSARSKKSREVEEANEQLKEDVITRDKHDTKWYIKRLHSDIDFFFRFFWDKALDPKQLEIADSYLVNPHTVAIASRQIGKTFTGGGTSARKLMFDPNTHIGLYAPKFEQAIDVGFGQLRGFLESQPVLMRQVNELKKSGFLRWNNGNSFKAITANKDSKGMRGYSPSVIWLDESQDIVDEIYHADILGSGSADKGITASGGRANVKETQILETLTPKGRNHAYKTIRPMPDIPEPAYKFDEDGVLERLAKGIDFEVIPSVWAMSGAKVVYAPWWESSIINLKFVTRQRNLMTPRLFAQEYCCAFNSSEGYAFNYDHVLANANIATRDFSRFIEKNNWYFGGVDLGSKQDHSVLTILHVKGTDVTKYQAFQYEWDLREEWPVIFAEMLEYMDYWKPNLTLVDRSGVGDPIFEDVFLRRCRFRCEPFVYTQEGKMQLMRNMQVHLANNWIKFFDDERFLWQMRDMPEEVQETGKVKYKKPPSGHDDRVQSMVLALKAATDYMGHGDGTHRAMTLQNAKNKGFRDFLSTNTKVGLDSALRKGKGSVRVGRHKGLGGGERLNFDSIFD